MTGEANTQSVTVVPEHMKPATVEPPAPAGLLRVIAAAVADPRMDVDKMSKLLDMHERIMQSQREAAFADAMTNLQAEMPQIDKHGQIIVKGVLRSKFAKIEDIDAVLKPLCAKHGFANSFDEVECNGERRKFSLTTTHRLGHSITKYKELPFDKSEFRSNVQSEGSTTSYAKRTLFKMIFNIIEKDEDDDGMTLAPITEDEALDLETMLQDTRSNVDGFLNFMGVDKIRDIRKKDLPKAHNAINQKRRSR